MSRGPAQDPPIAERVRPGRVLAEYGVALSRLATEISTGTTVVLKELSEGAVRTLPPADPKRSVWTRLVLPTQIEVDRGVIQDPPALRRGRHPRCLGAMDRPPRSSAPW